MRAPERKQTLKTRWGWAYHKNFKPICKQPLKNSASTDKLNKRDLMFCMRTEQHNASIYNMAHCNLLEYCTAHRILTIVVQTL